MSRIAAFKETHQKALEYIEQCKTSDREELRILTNWLLETDSNPYALFGDDGNWMGTAENFAGLLHTFNHALNDDGDLCFPVVNGEPRIRFVSKWDALDHPKQYVLTSQERQMDEPGTIYRQFREIPDDQSIFEISVITDVKEFITVLEASQTADLRRYFMNDAEDFGLEFAAERYQGKRLYNPEWISEFLRGEIDQA